MAPLTSQDEREKLWENLTDAQKNKLSFWRYLVISLGAAVLLFQPIVAEYFRSQEKKGENELARIDAQGKSALELSHASLKQISDLSTKLGEMTATNNAMKVEYETLKKNFADLTAKYQELLLRYEEQGREKKVLEQRMDLIMKNLEKKEKPNDN